MCTNYFYRGVRLGFLYDIVYAQKGGYLTWYIIGVPIRDRVASVDISQRCLVLVGLDISFGGSILFPP